MKKQLKLILGVVLLVAVATGAYFGYEAYDISKAPEVPTTVEQMLQEALAGRPEDSSQTEQGKALYEAYISSASFSLEGEAGRHKRDAVQTVVISALDIESLYDELQSDAQEVLRQQAEQARVYSEVYNEDLNYRTEVLDYAANQAFEAALEKADIKQTRVELKLRYEKKMWKALNIDQVQAALYALKDSPDALAQQMLAVAVENPEYVRKIHVIEETAKAGPEPDRSRFGSTTDPAVIEELVASPLAQQLINGQELVWNRDIELIPGSQIHYYLDESILTIVWQEEEAKAVGTFAETFIAHGSQLRRKIAGDTYRSDALNIATEFAKETNAVLAVGGDLYGHIRSCGTMVYEREIYRFEPNNCDTCYITADGDMLFSYRWEFWDRSQAEELVEENDVVFSLCFGPVLIDNGKDVTPDRYPWGEIGDAYARSALGLLGDKHYLTMNINCYKPGFYYLATLRQAADAMIEKGCIKAYTLDGGQTASTIINNQLINPVQFGWERLVTDIIYFATAVPNE